MKTARTYRILREAGKLMDAWAKPSGAAGVMTAAVNMNARLSGAGRGSQDTIMESFTAPATAINSGDEFG